MHGTVPVAKTRQDYTLLVWAAGAAGVGQGRDSQSAKGEKLAYEFGECISGSDHRWIRQACTTCLGSISLIQLLHAPFFYTSVETRNIRNVMLQSDPPTSLHSQLCRATSCRRNVSRLQPLAHIRRRKKMDAVAAEACVDYSVSRCSYRTTSYCAYTQKHFVPFALFKVTARKSLCITLKKHLQLDAK